MGKIKMELTDTTLNAIIYKLKPILENTFLINDGSKQIGGTVAIHHLYSILPKKLNTHNCMILFNYAGSLAMYWCKGDVFTFDGDTVVIESADPFTGLKKINKYKQAALTATEFQNLKLKAESNKYFSDSYWEDVKKEMDMFLYDDDGFGDF